MSTIKKNERYIPIKNYVTAVIIVVGAILLTLYLFQWYKVYNENRLSSSYLMKSNTITKEVNQIEEIESVFTEVPDSFFVYISYTGEQKVYELEKELKNVIKDYNLSDSFYFINVTSMKKEDNYLDKLSDALGIENGKIKNVPTILCFKNNELTKDGIIEGNNDFLQASDFQHYLDINEYKK